MARKHVTPDGDRVEHLTRRNHLFFYRRTCLKAEFLATRISKNGFDERAGQHHMLTLREAMEKTTQPTRTSANALAELHPDPNKA
jgi:hypothetical protein